MIRFPHCYIINSLISDVLEILPDLFNDVYVSARNHMLGVYSCMQMCLNVYSYMQITWVKQNWYFYYYYYVDLYILVYTSIKCTIFSWILLQICKWSNFSSLL